MPLPKTVNSISKAANLLKSLSQGVSRVTDLSTGLNLTKGTTYRLLKSLETSGLVAQDPITRLYYIGPLILQIASKPTISHQNLIICASQEMKYLRDLTGETVVLYIRTGAEKLCLEELPSLQEIKHTVAKGFVSPVYTGSAGKILLSELEENDLRLLLKNVTLAPIGPNTITDKKTLLNELRQIKKQGYALSFGERIPGSSSISVPIRNYICPVALSILGVADRSPINVMRGIFQEVKDSSSRISTKLTDMRY